MSSKLGQIQDHTEMSGMKISLQWAIYMSSAMVILISCNNATEIFKARRVVGKDTVEVVIYDDYQYSIFLGDSSIGMGTAYIHGNKVVLAPEVKNPFITLIHNQEYRIVGNAMCGITYDVNADGVNAEDTAAFTLRMPVESVNKDSCFEIVQGLHKEIKQP
jgi:hypothetical protein